MVLIKQLTIVLFAKTAEKHALISPGFHCYCQDSFSSLRPTSAYRRHSCMASRMICKYISYCVRQYKVQLTSSQRTRALSKKTKHKCGERTCPFLSMSVISWPSPDMAICEAIMILRRLVECIIRFQLQFHVQHVEEFSERCSGSQLMYLQQPMNIQSR